jgi:hypothetical protein
VEKADHRAALGSRRFFSETRLRNYSFFPYERSLLHGRVQGYKAEGLVP